MKLILAHNGNVEYDITDELFEAEIECMLDRLMSALSDKKPKSSISDMELVRALENSAWERMQHA